MVELVGLCICVMGERCFFSLIVYDCVLIGQDDTGGTTFGPQDWVALGRQLVNELETRTSEAIQSGKFLLYGGRCVVLVISMVVAFT